MKNRHGAKFSFVGYLLFLLPLVIVVSVAIVIFSNLIKKNFDGWLIALFIFLYIAVATFLFSLIDIIRRKMMVDRPVEQILKATERIAANDFNVKLVPLHTYYKYDDYDAIMENINKMTEELSKSEILKTEFISNVSHEIKTPLAVIKNYAKALRDESLDENQKKKYLETLINASQKLSTLVTNILKLNKLEHQTITPQKESINIGELLRENIIQFEDLFDKKEITLSCDIDDIQLLIEPSNLEIIYNNLISNAIKFTKNKGNIEISLKCVDEIIEFKVKDNGIGISKEVGARIFEKFYQADSSHSSEGNGLGLALVKRVIDIIGGEIKVESEEGKGSIFSVSIKKE